MLAGRERDRLFLGIDANAAALRGASSRALRARLPNLLYVRAAVEELPSELSGAADRVTVVLPWGSLLAAVARPDPAGLERIRGLCRPGAILTVVLAVDAERDAAEARRLGLPPFDLAWLQGPLAAAYERAGFQVRRLRTLGLAELGRWPSTWAKRLAHGRARRVFQLEARAAGSFGADTLTTPGDTPYAP